MSMFKRIALLLLAASVLALPAWAGTKEGDKEVSAAISISSSSASAEGTTVDTTTSSILGSFGYFTTKNVQLGGTIFNTESSSTSGGSTVELGTSFLEAFVKYHFNPDTTTVPYIGALLGTVSIKVSTGDTTETGSGTTIGAMAGIKFFMSEDLSINAEYNIRNYTVSIGGLDLSTTTGTALLGLSYYFH